MLSSSFIDLWLVSNFIRVRDALLLCLSAFRSPLRQQNWSILVVNGTLSSFDEKRILIEYNKKYYSNKAEFVTGYLFKVFFRTLINKFRKINLLIHSRLKKKKKKKKLLLWKLNILIIKLLVLEEQLNK